MGSKGSLQAPVQAHHGLREGPDGGALTRAFDDALASAAGLRAEAQRLGCPHCRSDRIAHWGTAHGFPRYRCGSCRRTFNILTNTPLARLRNKQRWLTFVGTMVEKKSIRKSAAACGVSVTTSSRWHQRFLRCSAAERAKILREVIATVSNASALAAVSGSTGGSDMAWVKELLPAILSWLI
jgi:transposase-like protein